MKKTLSLFLFTILSLSCPILSVGQLTVSDAFINAPKAVFPLLDQLAKLDMVDYFQNNMQTPSTNALEGKSRILTMSPQKMTIEMTNASTYEIDLLPTAKGDTVIALIATVSTPAHDSHMTAYNSDWSNNITDQIFEKPEIDMWLTQSGKTNKADVEALVPFLLVGYTFNPETGILILTNNTKEFLSSDIYEIVAPYFIESLSYKWDGKKFTSVK